MVMRWLVLAAFTALLHPCSGSLLDNYDCQVDSNTCLLFPSYVSTAKLSQRDVSYNASINEITTLGLQISNTLFNNEGVVADALMDLDTAMSLGVGSIIVDAYWSQANGQWQLCPKAFPSGAQASGKTYQLGQWLCQDNVTLDSVYDVIADYVARSDTNLAVNLMLLQLNLHALPHEGDTANNVTGDTVLSTNLTQALGGSLYTPQHLASDQAGGFTGLFGAPSHAKMYPSLDFVLLTEKKRLLALVDASDLPPNATYSLTTTDRQVFFTDVLPPLSVSQAEEQCSALLSSSEAFNEAVPASNRTTFQFVYDTGERQWDNSTIQQVIACGMSPVANTTISGQNATIGYVEAAFWSWAVGQPNATTNTTKSTSKSPVAMRCAALYNDGWRVANCYEPLPVLCRSGNESYGWTVSAETATYFSATDICPGGSEFSTPITALENSAARLSVESSDVQFPVWVDLNSIAINSCWVTGGPFSMCPYDKLTSNRNGVALLSVAAFVSLLLIILMILLNFRRIPLRRNQARWRRLMNSFAEQEYEGVPL